MLKFNLKNKGTITQYFSQNGTPLYKEAGYKGHGAIDYDIAWKAPVVCDNAGYVYKSVLGKDNRSNWQAVYTLCPVDIKNGKYMEIVFGHLHTNLVNVGDQIAAGTTVGLQGNHGNVYGGGVLITAAMQRAGDQRGDHVHERWRLVTRTKSPTKETLKTSGSRRYQDEQGYFYEIDDEHNGYDGKIDPIAYTKQEVKNELTDQVLAKLGVHDISKMSNADIIKYLFSRPSFQDEKETLVGLVEAELTRVQND